LAISWDIYLKYSSIRELQNRLQEVDQQLDANRFEHQLLIAKREYYLSDAYIERYAVEELDWLRPGDFYLLWP